MPAKSKHQPATSLEEIVNLPERIQAFGKSYEIRQFTLGPMTQAMEFIGPMGYLLRKLSEYPKDSKGNLKMSADQAMDFAVTAISISGPSVLGLISIATKEPLEWLEEQDPMDGLRIFAKVVEKNIPFFSRDNMDLVTQLLGSLQRQIPTLGGGT